MTANELTGLIGALGFPIVLLLGLLWFIKRDVWPWWTKRLEALDKQQANRHADFINAINRNGIANETMGKMLVVIDEKLDDHHDQTIRKLEIIEAVVTNRKPVESALKERA